jgi:hypothetical protein
MANTYNPIPKIGTGRFGFQLAIRTRLYAASDHLLIVQNTGYTEEYKRVAYGQIQQGMISGAILLLVLLSPLWGLPWLAAGLIGAPFILWFMINLVLGPTCRCYINTHVQTVQLPAPRRENKVPILLAFLKSQIPSSQLDGAEQPVA